MTRTVEWGPRALVDFQSMHWRTAARLAEGLQRFAETGEGTLQKVAVDGTRQLRLYVAPYFAWISVTPERVLVWRVLRYA